MCVYVRIFYACILCFWGGQDDGVGGVILSVKPYLMDLETTNGTFLNGDKIEDQRYYEARVHLI